MITLPTSSLGSLKHFLREHRDVMFKYVVRELNRGLDENAFQVNLFQFGETNLIASVRRPQFGLLLQQAMDYFKQHELYEDAAQCRDLLRRVHHDTDAQSVETYLQDLDNPSTKK